MPTPRDILIFRHIANEGPGTFTDFLDRHRLPYRIIRIDRGERVPEALGDTPALVFMGGSMSVNDHLPWIPKSLALIRAAVEADRPVLGHCLGGQLLSKALGGHVGRNRKKEIGWLPVRQLDNPAARDWLGALPPRFEAFHWHGETFSIPPGATNILESANCRHQMFVIGKSLGMQCHVEMTPAMILDWARVGRHEIARVTPTIQSRKHMAMTLADRAARLRQTADALYTRWLQGVRV